MAGIGDIHNDNKQRDEACKADWEGWRKARDAASADLISTNYRLWQSLHAEAERLQAYGAGCERRQPDYVDETKPTFYGGGNLATRQARAIRLQEAAEKW